MLLGILQLSLVGRGDVVIVHAATREAVAAATSQQAQLDALIAPWAGGNVTARLFSAAGVLLRTLTLPAFSVAATTPRSIAFGAHLADTSVATGTPGYWRFRTPGGVDIFQIRAGSFSSGAAIKHLGDVRALCTPTLQGVVITAQASLPVTSTPSWLAGKAIGEWTEIAGTSGAAGAQVDPWGAFAITPDGRLIISCSGGHGDSPDNRVVAINLTANSPTWETLMAASSSFQENVRHYSPDLHPVSRHNYLNTFYVPANDRIFHVGVQAYYSLGASWANTDAFRVTDKDWDAPNTWAPLPEGDDTQKGGVVFDGTHIWTNTMRKFNPVTNTWSAGASGSRITNIVERPWAFDSLRGQLFGVSWGTGTSGGGSALRAERVDIATNADVACTLNASTARDELAADAPGDAGMDYDPINDRFLFYSGQSRPAGGGTATENRRGKVYTITPTASLNAFDVSVLATTGPLPTAGVNAGINGRFKYVPALKGFVLLPQRTSNLWFFRVG